MRVLPGDLTSCVAGPLLGRRVEILTGAGETGVCLGNLRQEYVDAWYDKAGGRSSPVAILWIPVEPNVDTILRWLARHHGLTLGTAAPGWYYDDGESWRLHANGIWYLFVSPGARTTIGGERRICVAGISEEPDPLRALVLACIAAAA